MQLIIYFWHTAVTISGGEPDVVAEQVRRAVVQPVHGAQGCLHVEEGVVVAIQDPAVRVHPHRDVGQEGS